MKKKLVLPKFKNEDKEREFWWKLDLSEYYDPEDLEPVSFQILNQLPEQSQLGFQSIF